MQRRAFLGRSAAAGAALLQSGCGGDDHRRLAAETWGPSGGLSPSAAGIDLVRIGTLAANGHNAQPWRFALETGRIRILPDRRRRTPVVDPDDHHLYASLGCAAETIVQAARAAGLATEVRHDADADAVVLTFEPAPAEATALWQAIPRRRSTRAPYDGRPLDAGMMRTLETAAGGGPVDILTIADRRGLERILEHVVAGNTVQMNDPAFMAELKAWIRFDAAEAVAHRDGLYAAAAGNTPVPGWIGRLLFDVAVTAAGENDRYAEQIRSSSGVVVLAAAADDPAHWVEAGRAAQRFCLQATALGLTCAFLNQPVEVAAQRPRFAADLGIPGRRPDLVLRFGRGPDLPRSLRRPAADVLV